MSDQTRTSCTGTHPISDWVNQLHHGDAETILNEMPNHSVDCVVTSPPYWGLRDYNTPAQRGFEPDIDAYVTSITSVFDELYHVLRDTGTVFITLGDQ